MKGAEDMQINEIINEIRNHDICLKFQDLKQVEVIEQELRKQEILFEMKITVDNDNCNVIIKHKKLYADETYECMIKEDEPIYEVDKKILFDADTFEELIKDDYYYVDKTRMIEELLKKGQKVTLITRPRRFGKTLNMSMLADFFDIAKDSKELFKDTYIYKTKYVKEMNQWPVVFLSFLNCKDSEKVLLHKLYRNLLFEYDKYYFEFKNIEHHGFQYKIKEVYEELVKGDIYHPKLEVMTDALYLLIRFLYEKYNKRVILLIDEYDTPFMSAYAGKYYDHVKELLRGLLLNVLKNNSMLYKGILTGVQRIAKENLFSGLNNLEVCSMQDQKYNDMFGFTEEETRLLLETHHLQLNQEVKEMYDGYTIGGVEIYNPWSVLNYAEKRILAPYWINTGSNDVICQLLEKANDKVKAQYVVLLEKGEININCILEGAYVELKGATQLWALLVHAGYLTVKEKINHYQYILRIVNGEVKEDLIHIMMRIYAWEEVDVIGMFEMIQEGMMEAFEEAYNEILFNYPSYYDLKDENSYHVLMLGLCIIVSDCYEIQSNKEKGYGRADLYLKSKKGQKDIVIEIKYAEDDTNECLLIAANKAMTQILDKRYGDDAIKIGIGNHQKKARMVWKDSIQ